MPKQTHMTSPLDEQEKDQKRMLELNDRILRMEIQTSLSMDALVALEHLLFTDPRNPGEYIFALLAWLTGATAEELLNLKWEDIVPLNGEGAYALRIDQPGKKTNHRMVPLASKLYQFLKYRRDDLILGSWNVDGKDAQAVAGQHICCRGFDPFQKGDLQVAIQTLEEVLKAAGVQPEALEYLSLLIKYADEPAVKNEGYAAIYFMRRTFCTYAYLVGLTDGEVSYLMHLPMHGTGTTVSDFHHEAALTEIQKKISLHPYYQEPFQSFPY